MAITDWVQTAAAIYFAWQQNRIFKQQNQIIAAQSKRTAMITDASWAARLKRYWPTYVMLALIAVTAYDIYDRHQPHFGYDPNLAWDDTKPLERVYRHTFTNETIVLDNKNFIPPNTFDNVTLVYNGLGPFQVDDPHWTWHEGEMRSRLATKNKIVGESFQLAMGLAQAAGCKTGWLNLGPQGQIQGVPPASK